MIKLYSWTTPNGRKVSIALEEMGLPYKAIAIDIGKDQQFAPDFLKISPNNKIPALVDMVGQAHHFLHYKPGTLTYAEERYHTETKRLYGVLNTRLQGRDFIASALSIADFAIWPWVSRFDYHKVDLNDFPEVKRWYLALAKRPGFQRGYVQPLDVGPVPLPA